MASRAMRRWSLTVVRESPSMVAMRRCEQPARWRVSTWSWWVMLDDMSRIVAYCGSIYSKGICIFNRAWVKKEYRGQGIQRRMIRTRLKAASTFCHIAITYTTLDNFPSANNLIDCKFKLYLPEYSYGGHDKLYFQKLL